MKKCEKKTFLNILSEWFEVYLPRVRGVSQKTLESYKDCFRLLLLFFYKKKMLSSDRVCFESLDYDTIVDFLQWLEDERKCSTSTRNQRLSALSSFSSFAQNRNLEAATVFRTAILKIPNKRSKKKSRAFFTTEEIKLLLALPDTSTPIGLRNSVLLSTMYATGARAQEICNLKVSDLTFSDNDVKVKILGKGGKCRYIAIGKTPANILSQYLQKLNSIHNGEFYVFSSQTHKMMSVSCIEEILSKYVSLAKTMYPSLFLEKSYPPHSMRHTTACHMLEAGVSIVSIKNFLGHASINTTEIYAEMTQNSIDKAIRSWNEKWFGNEEPVLEVSNQSLFPDFLMRK